MDLFDRLQLIQLLKICPGKRGENYFRKAGKRRTILMMRTASKNILANFFFGGKI